MSAPTNRFVRSIRGEYERYKALAEGAIAQVEDAALTEDAGRGGNSIATICWHVSGNLRSRFTNFLTEDGEKPWRQREEEFDARRVTRPELLATWEAGHERVDRAAKAAPEGSLDGPHSLEIPTIKRLLPTKADLLAHLMTSHEASHIGHLSNWRRQSSKRPA